MALNIGTSVTREIKYRKINIVLTDPNGESRSCLLHKWNILFHFSPEQTWRLNENLLSYLLYTNKQRYQTLELLL